MATSTPQTVTFVLRVHYLQIERPAHLPTYVDFEVDEFEQIGEIVRREKRRRAIKDRATRAEYRQVLTDHGREMLALSKSDPDTYYMYSERSYSDAINGTWFTW